MTTTTTYDLYKKLDDENIVLSFKGVVTSELLNSMMDIMESKLKSLNESLRLKKKVFNILVECLQNLFYHTDDALMSISNSSQDSDSALIAIIYNGNQFIVRTGNFIATNKIPALERRLEEINQKDREGLRIMYRENLRKSVLSKKGTAGLGMIDMARRSGNKLEFDFIELNDELSFFSLNVKID